MRKKSSASRMDFTVLCGKAVENDRLGWLPHVVGCDCDGSGYYSGTKGNSMTCKRCATEMYATTQRYHICPNIDICKNYSHMELYISTESYYYSNLALGFRKDLDNAIVDIIEKMYERLYALEYSFKKQISIIML